MTSVGLALLADLALAAALAVLGWLLASALDRDPSSLFPLALSFPLGGGAFAWLLHALSLAGLRLERTTTLALLILALALAAWLRAVVRRLSDHPAAGSTNRDGWRLLPLAVVGIVWAIAVAVSILRSYATWDAAALWGVKGYAIAREGSIWAAAEWGAYGLAYPLNIPIQISLFALLDGDIAPGSKVIFPMFYAFLGLAAIAHWRRRGLSPGYSAVGAAGLLAIPLAFDHATIAYANLPFATYIFVGALLAIRAIETGTSGLFALSGAAFGLALWTRPEGLALVPLAYLSLAWIARRTTSAPIPYALWCSPSILTAASWIVVASGDQSAGSLGPVLVAAFGAVRTGDLNLVAWYWIGRYLAREAFRPSVWGMSAVVLAGGLALHVRGHFRGQGPQEPLLLASAVAAGLPILGFYYLVSFGGDLLWWLDTGLSRMMLPSALLAAARAHSAWLGRPAGP